jgi:hypothetical protein
MKRILREPLLHFLVLGAALFVAYSWLNHSRGDKSRPRQVRIGESDVKWLRETWVRQWQHEPTTDELRTLVTGFLREELLAREAHAMRLDENDTFIRRWLAQKMEFLARDTSTLVEPTEDDLRKSYSAHRERFQTEGRLSFEQVFFNRDRRKDAAADARAAREQLSNGARKPGEVGDPGFIDAQWSNVSAQVVASQFGREFADTVFTLKPSVWHGPIASPYGLHLVRATQIDAPRPLEFAEVKQRVLERWREEHQQEENDQYFASLLRKYDLTVDASVKPLIGPLVGKGALP